MPDQPYWLQPSGTSRLLWREGGAGRREGCSNLLTSQRSPTNDGRNIRLNIICARKAYPISILNTARTDNISYGLDQSQWAHTADLYSSCEGTLCYVIYIREGEEEGGCLLHGHLPLYHLPMPVISCPCNVLHDLRSHMFAFSSPHPIS